MRATFRVFRESSVHAEPVVLRLDQHLKLGSPLDQLDVPAGGTDVAAAGLEREGDADVVAEVGLELRPDVDEGRLPRGVLDDEEEFGDDLDDVSGL